MTWRISIPLMALVALTSFACSSDSNNEDTDAGACSVCEAHGDCNRGEYCDDEGCCQLGCAYDDDCTDGVCNVNTHECESGSTDGGTDAGGEDAGVEDAGGEDAGGEDAGGEDAGGGDEAPSADSDCPATFDKALGEDCVCDDECLPANPFCFADLLTDSGSMYCTIPDCTADSCPENYECNDFYTQADPPQPPFCQRCLGGVHAIGEDCLCDSDCDASAPDCFKNLPDDTAVAVCTVVDCTVGEGDECPGTYECTASIDMSDESMMVTFCQACDPGDHSLAEAAVCGCHKDCAVDAQCQRDGWQGDKMCITCLGGDARTFGETCICNSDCGVDFPTCLVSSKYCSILGCNEDSSICPVGSHCKDFFGIVSFCEIDE